MKLYATVTSERASKGQGGNRFLEVEILAEKLEGIPTRANIYRLLITAGDDNRLYATLHDYTNGTTQDLITFRGQQKGEQQKGEYSSGSCKKYHCSSECGHVCVPF